LSELHLPNELILQEFQENQTKSLQTLPNAIIIAKERRTRQTVYSTQENKKGDKIRSKKTTTQSETKSEFPETIGRRGEKVQYKAAQTKEKKPMNPVRAGSNILQG
jgi:hypothetical protein